MTTITNVTLGSVGVAVLERDDIGRHTVTAWAANGELAVTETYGRYEALDAARMFRRLSAAVR